MPIRILAAAAGALCLAAGAAAQSAPKPVAAAQPGLPPIPPPAPHQELIAAMRDGTRLAANVFLPEGKGPFPVVLMRTPYLKDRQAGVNFVKRYTGAGYAVVVQDVRG